MAGSQRSRAFRHPAYRRWISLRLWQRAVLAGAVTGGLAAGGCSYQLNSGNTAKKPEEIATGSIANQAQAAAVEPETVDIPEGGDLAIAKAAVGEVLSRGGKDASAPWENPATGARGTVTPLAQAYSQDGRTCRDFLASYVKPGTESWLQGEACRLGKGKWEVRSLRPWKRS